MALKACQNSTLFNSSVTRPVTFLSTTRLTPCCLESILSTSTTSMSLRSSVTDLATAVGAYNGGGVSAWVFSATTGAGVGTTGTFTGAVVVATGSTITGAVVTTTGTTRT